MALQKDIDDPYGSKATYWRVSVINANYVQKAFVVHLAGYINKDKRDADKNPIMNTELSFVFEDLPEGQEMPEITREFVYKHLKKEGQLLDGALDV